MKLTTVRFLFLIVGAVTALAPAARAETAKPVTGAPGDPATITAKAAMLTAAAKAQEVRTQGLIAVASAELARAQAAHAWALVRYLEDQRRILQQEYEEILRRQSQFRREIEELSWKSGLLKRARLGQIDLPSFEALGSLVAGAEDPEAVYLALEKPVEKLAANNFRRDPWGKRRRAPIDFPGGDVGELIRFAIDNELWYVEMRKAHRIVSRALATVTKVAASQILGKEQQIQAVRASRIAEVFLHPPGK